MGEDDDLLGRKYTVLMLCLDSNLLMQLELCPTEGNKTVDFRSSKDVSSFSGRFRA